MYIWEGRFPASVLARRIGGGATAAGVRVILKSSEWHHTSSRYNQTDYYDLDEAAEELAEDRGITVGAAKAEIVDRIRAASLKVKSERLPETAITGRFLVKDFAGRGRHKRLAPRIVEGTVLVKGNWTILPDGSRKASHNVRRTDLPNSATCNEIVQSFRDEGLDVYTEVILQDYLATQA